MTQSAWTRDGEPVNSAGYSSLVWEALKAASVLGDFVMPCCGAPAVLKTSINGVHFFAHLSDECATAPETKWHLDGKVAVLSALKALGIQGRAEVSGKSPLGKWEADVLFELGERRIAIELQHSYQHLRDYVRRQERYAAAGVECYWLTRQELFMTFIRASSRLRLKRDFGGVFPEGGLHPLLPEVPLAILQLEEQLAVRSAGIRSASLGSWLQALVEGRYTYSNGLWLFDT